MSLTHVHVTELTIKLQAQCSGRSVMEVMSSYTLSFQSLILETFYITRFISGE